MRHRASDQSGSGHVLRRSLRIQNRPQLSTDGCRTVLGYDRRNLAMSVAISPRELATIAMPTHGLSRATATATPITTPAAEPDLPDQHHWSHLRRRHAPIVLRERMLVDPPLGFQIRRARRCRHRLATARSRSVVPGSGPRQPYARVILDGRTSAHQHVSAAPEAARPRKMGHTQ